MSRYSFDEAGTRELNTEEPLEKYDIPPAYIFRLETSPRMISPHGAFTSYQVNVDANGKNITGDAANEMLDHGRPDQPQQDGDRLEAIQQRVTPIFVRAATDTPSMAAFTGRFPAYWKTTFFAAIPSICQRRQEFFLPQSWK